MSTVVVTGANRGIGLALCQAYAQRGWQVVGVCRESSDALAQCATQVITGIDVTVPAHLQQLRSQLQSQSIDLLINNAGILRRETLGDLDTTSIQSQFLVNALAPLKLTETLLPQLASPSKVVFITSRMGSIADNTSGGYYGYRMSKAALNAGAKSFALDAQGRGIAVAILHPGFVQTGMVNFSGDISADVSAERLMARIDGLTLENTGHFWHSNGESLPW